MEVYRERHDPCLLTGYFPMPTVFGRDYPTSYDVIIIGSGIGGLFCGNILAKAGLRVLLLERHYMLDQHFRDPRLKAVLMADTPHWGSLPDRTSYLFDAMLRLAYFLGNYYPKGSSQKFADDLGRGLTSRGGHILKCASVDKILIENGKAEGVRISTVSKRAPESHESRAPIVISNADALHTYENLIGEEHCGRWPIEHLKSLKPSYPCFTTHLRT